MRLAQRAFSFFIIRLLPGRQLIIVTRQSLANIDNHYRHENPPPTIYKLALLILNCGCIVAGTATNDCYEADLTI